MFRNIRPYYWSFVTTQIKNSTPLPTPSKKKEEEIGGDGKGCRIGTFKSNIPKCFGNQFISFCKMKNRQLITIQLWPFGTPGIASQGQLSYAFAYCLQGSIETQFLTDKYIMTRIKFRKIKEFIKLAPILFSYNEIVG